MVEIKRTHRQQELDLYSESMPEWALTYQARAFAPWSLTVDIVGFAVDLSAGTLDALVIERGQPPFAGCEAWPGGFVLWEQDPDGQHAALRELREETGQREVEFLDELGIYDTFGRDPRQFAGYRDSESGAWTSTGTRVVSRAFLALLRKEGRLLRPEPGFDATASCWVSAYAFLPWEDLRDPHASALLRRIRQDLERWADSLPSVLKQEEQRERIERLFSLGTWNEEQVRARWDLLWDSGLVEEASRDEWGNPRESGVGRKLAFDHRTMLADGLGALRTRIKREPRVAAALIGPEFKLSELQTVYEAVAGRELYRSNFRRAVTHTVRLVESSGEKEAPSGPGKPAESYHFLPESLDLHLSPGLTLPWVGSKA
jgi:hypothetical protein